MRYGDIRVGKFNSPHMRGDVRIEYCTHRQLFYLVYDVSWGVARCGYDPMKANEMRFMVLDAMDIAATPIRERN